MSKQQEQIEEKWVRQVFEKHSMEKSPDLELFDTDEVISELTAKINKLLIEAIKPYQKIIDEIESKVIYLNSDMQDRLTTLQAKEVDKQ